MKVTTYKTFFTVYRKGFYKLLFTLLFFSLILVTANAQDVQSQWQTLTPSEGEPMHRHENAYVRVGDKFYLLGGRGERAVQIYNPETGGWEAGAMPPLSMHHFQAVAYEGKIYVIGAFTGSFPDETPISNVYIYDPVKDAWSKGAEIPTDRRRGAAGAVAYNDKIYVIGGIQNGHIDGHVRWFDVFDPKSGEWKTLPNAPRYRDHFQAAVINGKLYAVGGRRTSQATGQSFELTIPEVDVYNFATGQWNPLPPSSDLPTERAGCTTVTAGGKLIVLGGESGSQRKAHAEVELYDPVTAKWISLLPMNTGRHGTQAIVYEGRIYIAAGSKTRGATEINSQEMLQLPEWIYD